MVTSLHELTKQLDALTYNSRSVLNAMIRSVLSAGSSEGYQVIRGGEPVTLTRLDIYHLYNLYQEWEAKISRESSTVDEDGVVSYGLAELVASMDADYQTENGDTSKTPYRDAVVKHAKILYMNSDNKDNTDDDWIALVDRSSNPKLVTNSAPIPINIRTPVYDENLSTKHFSEYETYLFPRGYYTLDAMGAYGDGLTHNAGGHKWLFDIDSVFQVKAPLSVFGVQDNKWLKQLPADYGNDKSYSLVVGYNCFSYGLSNFVSGRWNQVIGAESAVVGGASNRVYSNESVIAGGVETDVMGVASLSGGSTSDITGAYSFAHGYGATVGGHSYPFYMGVNINDGNVIEPTTECKETIEVDGCTYRRATSSNSSSTSNNGTSRDLGPNEIYIKYEDIQYSGIHESSVASGDSTDKSIFDFGEGDRICLYRLIPNVGSENEFPISKAIYAKVTGITAHTNSSGSQTYGYIVTLDKPVTPSHGLSVTRGYAMRDLAINYTTIDNDGLPSFDGTKNIGTNFSASIGIRTIASGNGQVVVGAQNKELLRPNFIVGIGKTDYIEQAERYNGLVVAPYYNYMTVRSLYVAAGMSLFTTADSSRHGMMSDSTIAEVARYDEDPIDKYAGYYAYSDNADHVRRALLRVYTNYTCLLNGEAGMDVYVPTESGIPESGLYKDIISTRLLGGDTGSVLISDAAGNNLSSMVDSLKTNFLSPTLKEHSVIVSARYQTVLNSSILTVIHGNYTQIAGRKLQIAFTSDTTPDHTTYDALVAYPAPLATNSTALNYFDKSVRKLVAYYGNELGNAWMTTREVGSGFYYTTGTGCLPSLVGGYSNLAASYHAISSSRVIYINDGSRPTQYSVAQLLLPGYVSTGSAQHGNGSLLAHPVFVTTLVDTNNPNTYSGNVVSMDSGNNYICEELAYLSDIYDLENNVSKLANQTIYDWIRPSYATLRSSATNATKTERVDGKNVVSWATYVNVLGGTGTSEEMYQVKYATVRPTLQNAFIDQLVNPDIYYGNKILTLNTVAINPASFMKFVDAEGNRVIYTMVAFSPMKIRADGCATNFVNVDADSGLPYLNPAYGTYAMQSTYGSALVAGLSSTPFSSMVSYSNQELNNSAAAVWIAMLNDDSVQWVRIIENLIVVFHNGHLTITFECCPVAKDDNYKLPAYVNESSTTFSWGASYIDDPDPEDQDYSSFEFYIPISPDKVGKLGHLVNPATGVPVQLTGRAAYTGDSNSFVTASFVDEVTFNFQGLNIRYNYPAIRVSIAGFHLTPGQYYHYEVQGDVAYVE